QDFCRRAGLDQFLEHLAAKMTRVPDLAVELAVREGPGAALTELDIGFRIEDAAAPQAPGVLGAFADGLSAVDNDRPETHLGQQQAGEKSAWPRADHHGP